MVGLLGVGGGVGVAVAGRDVGEAVAAVVFVAWGVVTAVGPSSLQAPNKSRSMIKLNSCFLITSGIVALSSHFSHGFCRSLRLMTRVGGLRERPFSIPNKAVGRHSKP